MPKNYAAYLRYKIIDECLRNRYHTSPNASKSGIWTLDEIGEKCYEQIGKRPSNRTLKLDIQRMKTGELGFEAPIENIYSEGYIYSDSQFSIHQLPIVEKELSVLASSLNVLKKFKGMQFYIEIQKILHRFNAASYPADFLVYEPVGIIQGFEYFDISFEAFENKRKLLIEYQPFKETGFNIKLNPGLIKEFNNRWYLIGIDENEKTYNLAFDRMKSVTLLNELSKAIPLEIIENQKKIIGVTLPTTGKENIVRLKVKTSLMPYFKTKPWHRTQIVKEENQEYSIVELKLIINIELISRILSFGAGVKVERPAYLRKRIKQLLELTLEQYE